MSTQHVRARRWDGRYASRRRMLAALSGAAGAGAVALACGGGGTKYGSGASQQTAAQPSAAAAQEQPRPGGVISQRLQTDPAALDVHQVTTFVAVWAAAPAFNQLVQFHQDRPADTVQDIVPDLAEKWEQPDPTTLVFSLRRGVTFHDGAEFAAEDVKVNLDWLKKPPQGKTSPRAATQATVDAVETPDPATVRVRFSRPTPSYLMNLSSHYFAIGQGKDIVANGEIGPKMLGTGPFRLKSYQRANTLELERSATYHRPGLPYLDGLKFFILPDYTTALTNFLAGQQQMFYDVQFVPSDADRITNETGDRVEVTRVQGFGRDLVFMNARRKPYDDVRVRQAISLAIDRDAAIKVVKQGSATRGGYMTPGGAWAIAEDELRRFDGYDKPNLDKAKQLLAAAGVQTPLEASGSSRTDFKDWSEFVKDALARVGINLKLNLADTATVQPVLQRGDFDIAPWVIGLNVDDPDATFSEISTSKAVRNWSAVYDAQLDALYDRQSQTLDTAERKRIVQELEKQALSVYQVATGYFGINLFAKYKTVRNFTFHQSSYTNRRMEAAWLRS